jgi:HAD superfamily hydrolase (TIGR01509 family)
MKNHHLAILWDLDGTIIDSKECHFNSWKAVFDKFGFPFSRSAYEENFGRNNQTALRIYLGFQPDRECAEALLNEKESIFRAQVAEGASLVPGVRTWLESAKGQHFHQVIASSAPMENIRTTLESFELQAYFDDFVSGAALPAKPEPDVFLEAARRIGHPPEHCMVIEDSIPGVHAAKNAAMRCIAVSNTGSRAGLEAADLVITNFTYSFERALAQLCE